MIEMIEAVDDLEELDHLLTVAISANSIPGFMKNL